MSRPEIDIAGRYRQSEYQIGGISLAEPFSQEQQLRYDLKTQFAELVDGNMRTEFELEFSGHDLIGEDGRGMDEITAKSLRDAERIADIHPELSFELRRRKLEREEYEEIIKMAESKGPNAKVIVSDFPAELKKAEEDIGGYNVKRQQTMLRVLTRLPNGNIKMYSQTLDGSNRQALEAIYHHFGIEPKEGELLGQRIDVDIPWGRQGTLVDELVGVYDRSLSKQMGGEWYAGRRPVDYRNTYDFVCQQTDILNECVRLKDLGWLNRDYMYKMAAEMQQRFNKNKQGVQDDQLVVNDIGQLHRRLEFAGMWAAEAGMSFSACGATLSSGGGLSGSFKNSLELAGYGNKVFGEDGDCEFISKNCPSCGAENVHTKSVRDKANGGRHVSGSCGCSRYYPD